MTNSDDVEINCADCGHSKAYHDLQDGRPCRAWDPDQPAPHKCVCPGWKDKPKGAPPAPAAKTEAAGGHDGQEF